MGIKRTIYFADDDFEDRMFLADAIHRVDPEIEIIEANNGADLLELIKAPLAENQCLIILDMNMPKMNGLETLANLRTIPALALIPAVLVSTSGNAEMMRFAKQLGAADYFTKPLTTDALHQLANQLIFDIKWSSVS